MLALCGGVYAHREGAGNVNFVIGWDAPGDNLLSDSAMGDSGSRGGVWWGGGGLLQRAKL